MPHFKHHCNSLTFVLSQMNAFIKMVAIGVISIGEKSGYERWAVPFCKHECQPGQNGLLVKWFNIGVAWNLYCTVVAPLLLPPSLSLSSCDVSIMIAMGGTTPDIDSAQREPHTSAAQAAQACRAGQKYQWQKQIMPIFSNLWSLRLKIWKKEKNIRRQNWKRDQ